MAVYPYWIDSDKNIWVKTTIPANDSILLYIKKESGHSPDGTQVFDWFDDFSSSINRNLSGTAYYDSANKRVVLTKNQNSQHGYYTLLDDIAPPFIVEWHSYIGGGSGADAMVCFYGSIESEDYDSGTSLVYALNEYHKRMGIRYDSNETKIGVNPIGNFNNRSILKSDGTAIFTNELGTVQKQIDLSIMTSHKLGFGAYCGGLNDWHVLEDIIIVRKYADNIPTATIKQITIDTWAITISNPNKYRLTDFQVAIPFSNIISSQQDSLLISDSSPNPTASYIYLPNTSKKELSGVVCAYNYMNINNSKLVDSNNNTYNWKISNGILYITIPDTASIPSGSIRELIFTNALNNEDVDTSSAKCWSIVPSEVRLAICGGNPDEIITHDISVDVSKKLISSTVVLGDGTTDTAQYDFSNEYKQIQDEALNNKQKEILYNTREIKSILHRLGFF